MAFANDKPRNSITWPFGAGTGDTRIVVGADTPDELVAFGVQVAILFYIRDAQSGLEVGYFFIGSSNMLDVDANDNVMLMGHVIYPTPGNPGSATSSNVKTHFQINMDEGEENPPGPITKFKDYPVRINTSVPLWQSFALLTQHQRPVQFNDVTTFNTDATFEDIFVTGFTDFQTDVTFNPNADRVFVGQPIGWETILVKATTQGTSQVIPVEEYDSTLFFTGLVAGLYTFDWYLNVSGPAASGGAVVHLDTRFEIVGTLTQNIKQWFTGPPDTTVAADLNRLSQNTQANVQTVQTVIRYGVQNQQVSLHQRCLVQWSTSSNSIYLKFMRNSSAAPAGDVNIQAGSHVVAKRWA